MKALNAGKFIHFYRYLYNLSHLSPTFSKTESKIIIPAGTSLVADSLAWKPIGSEIKTCRILGAPGMRPIPLPPSVQFLSFPCGFLEKSLSSNRLDFDHSS